MKSSGIAVDQPLDFEWDKSDDRDPNPPLTGMSFSTFPDPGKLLNDPWALSTSAVTVDLRPAPETTGIADPWAAPETTTDTAEPWNPVDETPEQKAENSGPGTNSAKPWLLRFAASLPSGSYDIDIEWLKDLADVIFVGPEEVQDEHGVPEERPRSLAGSGWSAAFNVVRGQVLAPNILVS